MGSWSRYCFFRTSVARLSRQCHGGVLKHGAANTRVRFAPSPTGEMHLGSLRTALYNYLYAKKFGGQFILRIEDTDQGRVVPGATERILDILKWAGICPDEGPSLGGDAGPYVQSERIELYKKYAHQLLENGHAYKCFCTETRLELLRKDALRNRQTPRYDNRCRTSPPKDAAQCGQPHVVRFKLFEGDISFQDGINGSVTLNTAETEGDPVILKSDGFPTYHLACVVDDWLMGVTHVLRGVEWQVSTPKHLMLYKALGWEPPSFYHLPLLLNKDGTKLSKRQGDIQVESLKAAGFSAEALLNFLVLTGGGFGKQGKDDFYELPEMVHRFKPEDLKPSSCRLDFERLTQLNQLHIQRCLDVEQKTLELAVQLRQLLATSPKFSCYADTISQEDIVHILQESKGRINSLCDLLGPSLEFLWNPPHETDDIGQLSPECLAVVPELCLQLEALSEDQFHRASLGVLLADTSKSAGTKYSQLMHTLRWLLSGEKQGPGVAEMMAMLGKRRTLERFRRAEKRQSQQRGFQG